MGDLQGRDAPLRRQHPRAAEVCRAVAEHMSLDDDRSLTRSREAIRSGMMKVS